MSCHRGSTASATLASSPMASAATGSQRSGACWRMKQTPIRKPVRIKTSIPTNETSPSRAPNAVARWSSSRPSHAAKHPNHAHRHGRTPHDTTNKPGTSLRRRRSSQCGHLVKTCAATGLSRKAGRSIGQIGARQSTYLQCLASRSRSPCTSITAAVANNPHSTEIRPRFPPCQICRRCSSR